MNVKTVEGLIGARTNIDLSDTAMGVFRQASQKGDTAAMERALGYAGEMVSQAEVYESKADEGMKADAKEQKEKETADTNSLDEKAGELEDIVYTSTGEVNRQETEEAPTVSIVV